MTTKHDVIRVHLENPSWASVDIAAHLGCNCAYVRATAQRNGLKLPLKQTGWEIAGARRKQIFDLGRAASDAGMTLGDIQNWKALFAPTQPIIT